MIRKRLAFAVLTLSAVAGGLFTAGPAQAHDRDYYDDGYRSYRRSSYYRSSSYYDGDRCYRPRRSRVVRYYRPRTRVVRYADSYYAPSYRTVSSRRYSCGCGSRFASAYWLDYHRDHTSCGY